MDFERYSQDFETAIEVSRELGFEVETGHSRHVGPTDEPQIRLAVEVGLRQWGIRKFSTSCGGAHTSLRQILQGEDSTLNPIITIGWVEFAGQGYFETSLADLKPEIDQQRQERSDGTFDYHAWLTLPDGDSLQLIDCTFGYYLYRDGKAPQPDVLTLDSGSPMEHHYAIEYYPLLAGQEALDMLCAPEEQPGTW